MSLLQGFLSVDNMLRQNRAQRHQESQDALDYGLRQDNLEHSRKGLAEQIRQFDADLGQRQEHDRMLGQNAKDALDWEKNRRNPSNMLNRAHARYWLGAPQREARQEQDNRRDAFWRGLDRGLTYGASALWSGYRLTPEEMDTLVEEAKRAGKLQTTRQLPPETMPRYGAQAAQLLGAGLPWARKSMSPALAKAIGQMPAPTVTKSPAELRTEVLGQQAPSYQRRGEH